MARRVQSKRGLEILEGWKSIIETWHSQKRTLECSKTCAPNAFNKTSSLSSSQFRFVSLFTGMNWQSLSELLQTLFMPSCAPLTSAFKAEEAKCFVTGTTFKETASVSLFRTAERTNSIGRNLVLNLSCKCAHPSPLFFLQKCFAHKLIQRVLHIKKDANVFACSTCATFNK